MNVGSIMWRHFQDNCKGRDKGCTGIDQYIDKDRHTHNETSCCVTRFQAENKRRLCLVKTSCLGIGPARRFQDRRRKARWCHPTRNKLLDWFVCWFILKCSIIWYEIYHIILSLLMSLSLLYKNSHVVTHADIVDGVSRAISGCICVCMYMYVGTVNKKNIEISSPTWQVDSTWQVLIAHFIWGQKVKCLGRLECQSSWLCIFGHFIFYFKTLIRMPA